jgi:thiol-disulfide isomerase/thioredoxin
MLRKILLGAIAVAVALTAVGSILYARNATPTVPAITAAQAAAADRPWVIKLHAQWCPVCMLTKGVWSQIEDAYAEQVRLVVLDFTNEAATAASRAEAARLGLAEFFDESGFATGPIVVLDGRTKETLAWINGSRDFADYRAAIDAALARSRGR